MSAETRKTGPKGSTYCAELLAADHSTLQPLVHHRLVYRLALVLVLVQVQHRHFYGLSCEDVSSKGNELISGLCRYWMWKLDCPRHAVCQQPEPEQHLQLQRLLGPAQIQCCMLHLAGCEDLLMVSTTRHEQAAGCTCDQGRQQDCPCGAGWLFWRWSCCGGPPPIPLPPAPHPPAVLPAQHHTAPAKHAIP